MTDNVNDLKEMLQNELFEGVEWGIDSLGSKGDFVRYYDIFYKVLISKLQIII